MNIKKFSLLLVLFFITRSYGQSGKYNDYPISMVEIKKVKLADNFWLPKIKLVQDVTIHHCLDTCVKEGRLENFLVAGKRKPGCFRGKMPFDDTDIYKIIEGASYSLISLPNPELEAYLDSIIDIIRIGQEPDGYITTWLTIDSTNPPAWWVPKSGGRWTRLSSSHELYNSGHLFESAFAHYYSTGKRNFLDIAIKNADLLVKTFGCGKLTIPPGHQIVETGLVKLYRVTGNEEYLKLAKFFLDLRGDSTTHKLYGPYSQDHKPVIQQDEIVGHAVRAVYMYAGMTDVGVMFNDNGYLDAVKKIWNNMVEKKMYITGGIGARHDWESLGENYELPNLTAYCETCASIGNVYWNLRLFRLTGDAKYFNVIERILYNGLIAGISLDGKNFFYVNPLEADGKFKFNSGSNARRPWFDCACCPTNLVRFIPSIPGLIYAVNKDTLFVNLYVGSQSNIILADQKVDVVQETNYPISSEVRIKVNPQKKAKFTIKVRIPGWVQNEVISGDLYKYIDTNRTPVQISVNGKIIEYSVDRGYAVITRTWSQGAEINLSFPVKIRRVIANEKVKEDSGLVALEYGPFVYCVEGIDSEDSLNNIIVPDNVNLNVEYRSDLLGGVNVITGFVPLRNSERMIKLVAIPYYTWANRGTGTMKVWLPRN